ncbi:MAG: hypothetical protein ACYDIA_12420 [Candidatus Humimicrobiaceae bacterium]
MISFFEDNIGFITFLTFMALLWYAGETRRLVNKTNDSNILTKEKEKKDRALSFLEKFELERFFKLQHLRFVDYPKMLTDIDNQINYIKQDFNFNADTNNRYKGLEAERNKSLLEAFPDAKVEINYFLEYFDTVSIFYNKDEKWLKRFFNKSA